MNKTLKDLLFLLLYFCFFLRSIFSSETSEIKYQVEVSLDITKEASKKILKHYKFKPKERVDYVFDIYDGEDFLLFPQTEKIRFRLKEEEDKRLIQINSNIGSIKRVCENGISIEIKEKQNGEVSPTEKEYLELIEGNKRLEEALNNPKEKIPNLLKFHETVHNLNSPLQRELEESLGLKKWIYLPINRTVKTKWKKKIETKEGEIIISITKGKDYLAEKYFQDKWELEFQINPAHWKEKNCETKYCSLEKQVCDFLKTERISNRDLNPPKNSPYESLKKMIQPLNKELGF